MRFTKAVLAGLCLGVVLFSARPASAQVEVSATLKGTIGCGLLGAELPLMVESIIGVRNGWVLGLSAIGGGVGGGLLGYFVVEETSPELSIGSLVAGMALVIPTVGLVVNATSYRPDEGDSFVDVNPEDEVEGDASATGESGDGAAQGGFQLGGSTGGGEESPGAEPSPPQHRPAPRPGVSSVLRLDAGALALAWPSVTVVPRANGAVFGVSIASGTF